MSNQPEQPIVWLVYFSWYNDHESNRPDYADWRGEIKCLISIESTQLSALSSKAKAEALKFKVAPYEPIPIRIRPIQLGEFLCAGEDGNWRHNLD